MPSGNRWGVKGDVGPAHTEHPPNVYGEPDRYTLFKHMPINGHDGGSPRRVMRYNLVLPSLIVLFVFMYNITVCGWTLGSVGQTGIDLSFKGYHTSSGAFSYNSTRDKA